MVLENQSLSLQRLNSSELIICFTTKYNYHYKDSSYQQFCYPPVEESVDVHPVIFDTVVEAAKNPEEQGTDE